MHKTLSLGYISRAGMEDCKKKIFFLAKNGGLCTKGVIHTGGGWGLYTRYYAIHHRLLRARLRLRLRKA